jgi:hypothetical protein
MCSPTTKITFQIRSFKGALQFKMPNACIKIPQQNNIWYNVTYHAIIMAK